MEQDFTAADRAELHMLETIIEDGVANAERRPLAERLHAVAEELRADPGRPLAVLYAWLALTFSEDEGADIIAVGLTMYRAAEAWAASDE